MTPATTDTAPTGQGPSANRRQITTKVFTKFQDKRELDNGYALRYPANDEWSETLDQFTGIWSKSCPYFDFRLEPEEGNGHVWLRITGPDGTKSFVHGVPLYGTLVALEIAGRASVGVIYMPGLDEVVYAAIGASACAILGWIASLALPDSERELAGLTIHTLKK